MRGIFSLVTDIRKGVFTEVARMAYAGNGYAHAEDIPFTIVPGDMPRHRDPCSWSGPSWASASAWPWA